MSADKLYSLYLWNTLPRSFRPVRGTESQLNGFEVFNRVKGSNRLLKAEHGINGVEQNRTVPGNDGTEPHRAAATEFN